MNKMGHCEWGCSFAIFAVLALCGLCQYAFWSLLIDDVFLFSIWGNVWLFKRVVFSPVLSQRKEQRVNYLRYNQKFLLHCLCFVSVILKFINELLQHRENMRLKFMCTQTSMGMLV